jgi:hypothetical protein
MNGVEVAQVTTVPMDAALEAQVLAKLQPFRIKKSHRKYSRCFHHRWIYPKNRRQAIQCFSSQQITSIKRELSNSLLHI